MDTKAQDMMRREFHRLKASHADLSAQAAPHRVAYDALQPDIDALMDQQRAHADLFKPIEAQMSDIANDMGALAVALRGKTGDAPPPEEEPS